MAEAAAVEPETAAVEPEAAAVEPEAAAVELAAAAVELAAVEQLEQQEQQVALLQLCKDRSFKYLMLNWNALNL
jgi:hypothetical protein